MIHINLDKKTCDTLHTLMDIEINDKKTKIMVYKVHTGSKQSFYRKLVEIGIKKINEELKEKIEEYQNGD